MNTRLWTGKPLVGLLGVLFGLGMARLGMALGYPIIMGLISSLGALIPLLVFFPQALAAVGSSCRMSLYAANASLVRPNWLSISPLP